MDLHAKQRQEARNIILLDLEPEPCGRSSGYDLGRKLSTVVEKGRVRDAIAVNHISDRKLDGETVGRGCKPVNQHLSRIHIREKYDLRTHRLFFTGPVDPEVKLVKIALNTFKGLHRSLVAGLMRVEPVQRLAALAHVDLGRLGDRLLVQSANLMDRRDRNAFSFGNFNGAIIAGRKTWRFQPQEVTFDKTKERAVNHDPRLPLHQLLTRCKVSKPILLIDPVHHRKPLEDGAGGDVIALGNLRNSPRLGHASTLKQFHFVKAAQTMLCFADCVRL